jgi:hypothetical protein
MNNCYCLRLRRWKCFAAWLGLPRNHRASKKLLKDVQAENTNFFLQTHLPDGPTIALGLHGLNRFFTVTQQKKHRGGGDYSSMMAMLAIRG